MNCALQVHVQVLQYKLIGLVLTKDLRKVSRGLEYQKFRGLSVAF